MLLSTVNWRSHPGTLHKCGRAPVCELRCVLSVLGRSQTLPQKLHVRESSPRPDSCALRTERAAERTLLQASVSQVERGK